MTYDQCYLLALGILKAAGVRTWEQVGFVLALFSDYLTDGDRDRAQVHIFEELQK